MKRFMVLLTVGLLFVSGSALAQDRRGQHGRAGHSQPHSHSHRHPNYLGPAIIGGAILGYGLYNAPRYYAPPPTYYDPTPVVPYVYEEKIWDSYCGCYRLVTR